MWKQTSNGNAISQGRVETSNCQSGQTECTFADPYKPKISHVRNMFENFMDFTYDSCRQMFTKQQMVKMRVALSNGVRKGLIAGQNTRCISTSPDSTSKPKFPEWSGWLMVVIIIAMLLVIVGLVYIVNQVEYEYDDESQSMSYTDDEGSEYDTESDSFDSVSRRGRGTRYGGRNHRRSRRYR